MFFNIAQALETEKTKMLKYIIDKYYTKVERPPKIPAPRISTELETQLESQVLILQDRLNLIEAQLKEVQDINGRMQEQNDELQEENGELQERLRKIDADLQSSNAANDEPRRSRRKRK